MGGRGWGERGRGNLEKNKKNLCADTTDCADILSDLRTKLGVRQHEKDGRRTSVVTAEKEKKRVDLIIIYRIQELNKWKKFFSLLPKN
jgi:hypothetical protein